MPAKLLQCIRTGLLAAGECQEPDTATAGGLGEAVHEYLRASFAGRTISSQRLAGLVELVLTQTGHSAAALAIRQHRRQREQLRRTLLVAAPRPSDGRFAQHRWDKAAVVRHLKQQHLLDAPASRMIAGRVEQLVFNCGLRVVTSGLVTEMARSELLAWGLLPGALAVKRSRPAREVRRVSDNQDSA